MEKIPFMLYAYVLAKILQNCAKFIQKLTPSFKSHMRNFGNIRKVVESPKNGNSMNYFCPKNKFLQLKHYIHRIYLTLLSTTCVKFSKFLMSFLKPLVIFDDTPPLHFSSSNITYFLQK